MSAIYDDSVLDAALSTIATGTDLYICTGTPTDQASTVAAALAHATLTSADFTLGAGSPDGRQVSVAAKSGVSVTASGTAASYCITDGTTLLARTDVDAASPALSSGSTTDIPAVSFAIAEPTVV